MLVTARTVENGGVGSDDKATYVSCRGYCHVIGQTLLKDLEQAYSTVLNIVTVGRKRG